MRDPWCPGCMNEPRELRRGVLCNECEGTDDGVRSFWLWRFRSFASPDEAALVAAEFMRFHYGFVGDSEELLDVLNTELSTVERAIAVLKIPGLAYPDCCCTEHGIVYLDREYYLDFPDVPDPMEHRRNMPWAEPHEPRTVVEAIDRYVNEMFDEG